jgi:hypothetical protein
MQWICEILSNEGLRKYGGYETMMKKSREIPDFKDDEEISAFMEAHNGFELIDQGLAEIVETPTFSKKDKRSIELDLETLQLVDELVSGGICTDTKDAIKKAIHSYVLAVLPDSYKLVREN